MANHTKPTPEELKAQEEEALKDIKEIEEKKITNLEDKEDSDEAKELKEKEAKDKEPVIEEEPEKEVTPEIEGEEEPEKEEESVEEENERLKKENSASSREAQKIHAKNRVLNKALIDADEITEPTEEELQKIYGSDWDVMSDAEKEDKKEIQRNKRFRETIKLAKDQAKKIEKWTEDVTKFTDDPKTLITNPELEGKTEEFKVYAQADENNNIPLQTLVNSFLYKESQSKVKNKGAMFPKGNGGPNTKDKPKSNKVSLTEASQIMKNDYPRYKELLDKRLIDYDSV